MESHMLDKRTFEVDPIVSEITLDGFYRLLIRRSFLWFELVAGWLHHVLSKR